MLIELSVYFTDELQELNVLIKRIKVELQDSSGKQNILLILDMLMNYSCFLN